MKRYGSDVIVDLFRDVGVEAVAFNPGASVRGIHDSLVHADDGPRLVLCLHEEIAVAAAQGYAKAAGKPMAVLLHDVVGLQHASMAIYNAWCDRVPMLLVGGTGPMSKARRRPWIDWIHTALVQGQQVRDYVKWDDQPHDLESLPESFARAWTTTCAVPPGPVYLCLDVDVQEEEVEDEAPVPFRAQVPTSPAPAREDVELVASLLREARRPVLVTDYAGATPQGFAALGELAELAQAEVVDFGARFNFPTQHELCAEPDVLSEADVIVALDVDDPAGRLRGLSARIVNVTPAHLRLRSWAHDYQPLLECERVVSAAAEAALPAFVEALRERPPERRAVLDRGTQLAAWREEAARHDTGRLALELGRLLEGRAWRVVNGTAEGWERRLWPFERWGQHLGWHGGGGLGYGMGAAIGAAIAIQDELLVNLQPDGDLLYAPQALWTAAHERLPILTVVVNNRQYRNTVEHAERVARHRGRDSERRHDGSAIRNPDVDFAALARSFGMWAKGPVSPDETLSPALEEAIAVVESGAPALVDVVVAGA